MILVSYVKYKKNNCIFFYLIGNYKEQENFLEKVIVILKSLNVEELKIIIDERGFLSKYFDNELINYNLVLEIKTFAKENILTNFITYSYKMEYHFPAELCFLSIIDLISFLFVLDKFLSADKRNDVLLSENNNVYLKADTNFLKEINNEYL